MTHSRKTRFGLPVALGLVTLALSACGRKPGASAENEAPMQAASAAPAFKAASPKAYESPPSSRIGMLAPGTGIAVGERAPDIKGLDLKKQPVALSSLYEQSPVLLAFYRGGWCPYCNMEIHSLAAAYPQFQKRRVTPVALSVDVPEAESVLQATYTIPFPVLSDTSAAALLAFHVVNKVDAQQLMKMKSFGIDLESYSGQSHHEIAIPSLFLIDKKGIVRWAHSDPDYMVRPSTAQILAAIDSLDLS
jgi:peroxiredoxin